MDRNITTARDATAINQRRSQAKAGTPTVVLEGFEAGARTVVLEGVEAEATQAPEQETKPDNAVTRLAKYIPAEALSAYLTLAGLAAMAVPETATPTPEQVAEMRYWLLGTLVVTVVFNVLYLSRIWRVERKSQILTSCVALVVYALATGGPLVQSLHLPPVLTPFAVAVVTLFLAFFQPPEERTVPPVA